MAGPGLPPASRTGASAERLFDREVERAAERAGGEAAVEERRSARSEHRRDERHSSFGAKEEPGRAARSGRPDPSGRPPAAARRAARSEEHPGPVLPAAPGRLPEIEDAVFRPPQAQGGPADTSAAPPAAQGGEVPAVSAAPGAANGAAAPGAPAGGPATPEPVPVAAEAGSKIRLPARPEATVRAEPAAPAEPEAPPEEAHDVLRQIRLHLAHGVREATLTLVPLHLGRLQMKLSLSEGKVAAVVRAESKETLKLLEQHLPELRAALAEQGFAVGSFELELGASADDRRAGRGDAGPRAALRPARLDESAISERLAHLLQRLSPSAGGVDTYA